MVIPKHFVPPMAVNLVIGSVLWSTYGEASEYLRDRLTSPLLVSALSGGIAGGMQALVAAPAENVRFALEGGTPTTGWKHAWQEVFRGTDGQLPKSREARFHDAREVRQWMKDVGEMAGRGWDGWGWGCAKDICGFALFFSIFELTRHVASQAKQHTEDCFLPERKSLEDTEKRRHAPRIVHATALVVGGAGAGLAYELASRPWDIARKAVHIDRITSPEKNSIPVIVLRKLKDDGMHSFFENPTHATTNTSTIAIRRRINSILRTVARVGPWGMGFLMWEAFGHGIS